jgi:hypothetical protein
MCRTFTFYHLCGHVHHNHTIPCPSPIPFMSSPPSWHSSTNHSHDRKVISPSPSCVDTAQEPHHYPTLCNACKKIGIISEFFTKKPYARREAVMEWRKVEGKSNSRPRSLSDSKSDAMKITNYQAPGGVEREEDMPFIQPTDVQSHDLRRSRSESNVNAATVTHVGSPIAPKVPSWPPKKASSNYLEALPPSSSPLPDWLLAESKTELTPATTSTTTADAAANAAADKAAADNFLGIDPHTPSSTSSPCPSPSHAESPAPSARSSPTSTDTEIDVKATIHSATLRVNRMAALNQTMKSRLPLPVSPVSPVLGKEKERQKKKGSLLPLPKRGVVGRGIR